MNTFRIKPANSELSRNMSGYVRGKSIVITGGTTGLGFGLIRELLENGAKVSADSKIARLWGVPWKMT